MYCAKHVFGIIDGAIALLLLVVHILAILVGFTICYLVKKREVDEKGGTCVVQSLCADHVHVRFLMTVHLKISYKVLLVASVIITVISYALWIVLLVYATTNGEVFVAGCEVLLSTECLFSRLCYS